MSNIVNPSAEISPFTGVESVTGLNTDNTDPQNPVVKISVDGSTVFGDGTPGDPLNATGVQPGDLAAVAFSGDYNDLSTKGASDGSRVQGNGSTVSPFSAPTLVRFMGSWSASITYAGNDMVIYSDGSCYLALANNLNATPPSNPSVWQQIGSTISSATSPLGVLVATFPSISVGTSVV
jgi:hypothetical protein